MNPLDTKIERLSPEHRRQVEDFIDFLLDRYDVFQPVHGDDRRSDRERDGLENHPIVLPTEPVKPTGSESGREVIYVHAGNMKKSHNKVKSDDLLDWFD
jgi:hypothetical protein